MVDHIFNEARSEEVLHELRAEAEQARLVRQIKRPGRRLQRARTGMLAGFAAAWLHAAIGKTFQTAN